MLDKPNNNLDLSIIEETLHYKFTNAKLSCFEDNFGERVTFTFYSDQTGELKIPFSQSLLEVPGFDIWESLSKTIIEVIRSKNEQPAT